MNRVDEAWVEVGLQEHHPWSIISAGCRNATAEPQKGSGGLQLFGAFTQRPLSAHKRVITHPPAGSVRWSLDLTAA